MALNLTHLRAFLTVVEEGSINRAAARLLRAQPAVGRQIKLLEESFGLPLLERSSAGVQPTAAGLMLVEHARLIFQDIARAEAAMAGVGQEPAGIVTVALPSSLVEQLSTRLFGEVKARYPLIKLNLMEGDSHAVAGWMREQRADLALLPDGGQDLSLHSMACATRRRATWAAKYSRWSMPAPATSSPCCCASSPSTPYAPASGRFPWS